MSTNETTNTNAKAAKGAKLGTGKRIAKGAGKAAKAAAGKAGAAKAPKAAKGVRGQTRKGKVKGGANTTVDYAKRYQANYADVSKFGDDLGSKKIKVLVENPKRGASRDRFALLRSGMSVATAIEKGYTRADVRFDLAHKYIALQ
jgi:hypothetical protein